MSTTYAQRLPIPEMAAMLAAQAEAVARYLLPNGQAVDNEWCVGSIHGEPGESLKVHLSGEKAGVWKDFADVGKGGDLVDLWAQVRRIDKSGAIPEIREYLGLNRGLHVVPPLLAERKDPQLKSVSRLISSSYHKELRSALCKNEEALAYLTGELRGLKQSTIDHFGLGLSKETTRADGTVSWGALVAPMRSPSHGRFLNKSAYITIPHVTVNPIDDNGWMKGSPQCYYADSVRKQTVLFVCEGLKDVWRHWQALTASGLTHKILLISSTHGSVIPAEWKDKAFWSRWEVVYLGQDSDNVGDAISERVLEHLGREAFRIRVPAKYGKDWTDFWQAGGSVDEFTELLDEAPVASGATIEVTSKNRSNAPRPGRFSHKPVDINGAYINGYLYYPTETRVVIEDESGRLDQCLETVVIRSDRTVHKARYASAPAGTAQNKRILWLTDGTYIEKEPKVSTHRTWDYEAIEDYLNGKAKVRPLKSILEEVLRFLRQSIWLPYEEDYVVLTLTVPVTYTQAVFESVPLLFMNGSAGSGKSQTGNTMARMCANGIVVGQVSAASAARLIDETRGFVVLDDIESIAAKAGKDIQVNEFVQALKVSYNKHTAVKFWTDVKTMKTERLDFFGVKLLSNTLGADAVLGSRMIRIQTRKMPEGMKSNVRDFTVEELQRLAEIRNELHAWAFQSVRDVDRMYREVYTNKTDRQAEIAAPLRTMARLVGDPDITAQLEAALSRQHMQGTVVNDDPVETLKEAVKNLIRQGFDTVTVTHLRLEMRALIDAHYGMSSTNEIPEWDRPEWLGRQLRSNDLVDDVNPGRMRLFGKNLRLVSFAEWIREEAMKSFDENGTTPPALRRPQDFCSGCDSCPYRMTGCDIQDIRIMEESRNRSLRH